MIEEGSVLFAASLRGRAVDVAPDGFSHPVYRAGFALAIRVPHVGHALPPVQVAEEAETPVLSTPEEPTAPDATQNTRIPSRDREGAVPEPEAAEAATPPVPEEPEALETPEPSIPSRDKP